LQKKILAGKETKKFNTGFYNHKQDWQDQLQIPRREFIFCFKLKQNWLRPASRLL
jgi:hypothetical protein